MVEESLHEGVNTSWQGSFGTVLVAGYHTVDVEGALFWQPPVGAYSRTDLCLCRPLDVLYILHCLVKFSLENVPTATTSKMQPSRFKDDETKAEKNKESPNFV